jgi:UDP-glucose 4-epimerase
MTVIADNARARQAFDWQPQYADLDVIIASSLAWERSLALRNTVQGNES